MRILSALMKSSSQGVSVRNGTTISCSITLSDKIRFVNNSRRSKMALIDDMYVPAINWRQGEYQALLRLTDLAKGRILPLITIPKIEYDFDDGMPKHTVQEHVEKFPTRYKQKWKSRPAWIDVHQSLHAGTMTGGTSVCEFVFDELRKFGAKAIPVAAIDYAPGV